MQQSEGGSAVPDEIAKPIYWESGVPPPAVATAPLRVDQAELEAVRTAAAMAREVLDYTTGLVGPGVTTDELDRAAHAKIIELGAYPSPLNYGGFPKSVCTSVNNVVCHGIPDDRALRPTDVINIDVSVYVKRVKG